MRQIPPTNGAEMEALGLVAAGLAALVVVLYGAFSES